MLPFLYPLSLLLPLLLHPLSLSPLLLAFVVVPPPLAVALAALVHVPPLVVVVCVCNPPRVSIVRVHVLPPVVFCVRFPPPTAADRVHVPLQFSVPLLPVVPNAPDLQ